MDFAEEEVHDDGEDPEEDVVHEAVSRLLSFLPGARHGG